jgi:hypothetical protein
LSQCVRKSA